MFRNAIHMAMAPPLAMPRRAGATASLALHALALSALLAGLPAGQVLQDAPVISVQLLTTGATPAMAPREAPNDPPPPRRNAQATPVQRAPTTSLTTRSTTPSNATVPAAPQVASAPSTAPASASVAAPANPSQPGLAASPSAQPAAGVASPTAAPPAAPPPAPAETPPVFNAAYLDNPAPAYPALSRRSGEQGRVLLRVLVNAAGRADDVQLRSSSGSARLDEAARETVRRWRFVPARRGDEAVPAWVLVPISFSLGG